jgi:hypothetical protein
METIQTLLAAYEASALGAAARGTVWLYPVANLLHVLGAALLLGAIAVFDVAVLRASRAVGAIARIALPIAITGLALQIITGLVLFAAEATTMAWNPAFLLKITALVLGLVNLAFFHWRFDGAIAEGLVLPGARTQATISLAMWTVAVLAGRGIAYL